MDTEAEALTYEYQERFCLNSKCSWSGHRATEKGKNCPICGSPTCFYSGNDGFLMIGPQSNRQYPPAEPPEDYEPYEDNRSEFIRPYNERYFLGSDLNPSLPKNYHYSGMYKVKAGKGYRRDGHPVGVMGHKCEECDGTIISLQMNTSSRGFETTSEKVCNKCGLTYPGSFQILEKKDTDYHSKYSDTHEEWVEQNKPTFDLDDVDMELERWANWNGKRNDSDTDDTTIHFPGDESGGPKYINPRYAKRLKDARGRLDNVPASKKMPMKAWREREYNDMVDDYAHELGLNKLDVADVKYYIKHLNDIAKWPYKMEDVIYTMCLVVAKRDLRKYRGVNRRLYDLLTDRLGG